MPCPANSQGAGIASGCTCNSGYTGSIVVSANAPYYYGSCVPGTPAFTNAQWSLASLGAGPWASLSDVVASSTAIVVTDGTSAWNSVDGLYWSACGAIVSGKTGMGWGLAYNGAMFLAYSSSTTPVTFAYSTNNGATWTSYTNANAMGSYLSAANGAFFVTPSHAASGTYFTSTDGLTWTQVNVAGAIANSNPYSNVAYGAGIYATIGMSYTATMLRGTSPTTLQYSNSFSTTCSPCGIVSSPGGISYGAGVFLTVNRGASSVMTSPAASPSVAWTYTTLPFTLNQNYFVNDRFFVTSWLDSTVMAISQTGTGVWYPVLLPTALQGRVLSRVVYSAASGKFWVFSTSSGNYASMPTA